MVSKNEVLAAHKFCDHHRDMAGPCGCFYCERTFDASEITEWIDNDSTAVCPYCRIDSVIPASKVRIDPEFLRAMHAHWFW